MALLNDMTVVLNIILNFIYKYFKLKPKSLLLGIG